MGYTFYSEVGVPGKYPPGPPCGLLPTYIEVLIAHVNLLSMIIQSLGPPWGGRGC